MARLTESRAKERLLNDENLCLFGNKILEVLDVILPSMFIPWTPKTDIRSKTTRSGIELLISRILAYDMISRADQPVEDKQIGANGTICDKNIRGIKRIR